MTTFVSLRGLENAETTIEEDFAAYTNKYQYSFFQEDERQTEDKIIHCTYSMNECLESCGDTITEILSLHKELQTVQNREFYPLQQDDVCLLTNKLQALFNKIPLFRYEKTRTYIWEKLIESSANQSDNPSEDELQVDSDEEEEPTTKRIKNEECNSTMEYEE